MRDLLFFARVSLLAAAVVALLIASCGFAFGAAL
jgi:hypothetical protein